MSLDKFGLGVNPAKKTSKKSSKKSSNPKKVIEDDESIDEDGNTDENDQESSQSTPTPTTSGSSKRKALKCTDAKCGYKRVVFKTILSDEDLICQKCGKSMKLVK